MNRAQPKPQNPDESGSYPGHATPKSDSHCQDGQRSGGVSEKVGVRAGIARRWRWPLRLVAGASGAALAFAWLCPAMLTATDAFWVLLGHSACMLLTFGMQAGAATAMVAAAAWALGRRRTGAMAAIVACAWLAPTAQQALRLGAPPAELEPQSPRLTVLSINALYGRGSVEAIAEQIKAVDADVVLVQEFTPGLESALKGTMTKFPHQTLMARDDAFGQGVYSRFEFAGPPQVYPTVPSRWSSEPQITVHVRVGGRFVRITNIHLLPPVGVSYVAMQQRQALGLAAMVDQEQAERPAAWIIGGDFNATTHGHILPPILRAGLVDSHAQVSRVRGGTWPARGAASALGRIRIDNLLHSPQLVCIASGVGIDIGSDHLPTWATYGWNRLHSPTAK